MKVQLPLGVRPGYHGVPGALDVLGEDEGNGKMTYGNLKGQAEFVSMALDMVVWSSLALVYVEVYICSRDIVSCEGLEGVLPLR